MARSGRFSSRLDRGEPLRLPRFVEHESFTRDWMAEGLTDEDLRALQSLIMQSWHNSRICPLIQGTGGLRKARLAAAGRPSGKSGGYRVCFAVFPEHGIVLLSALFSKHEREDLSQFDRREIARYISRVRDLLDRGMMQ